MGLKPISEAFLWPLNISMFIHFKAVSMFGEMGFLSVVPGALGKKFQLLQIHSIKSTSQIRMIQIPVES